jgi:hypothetical protein
MKPVLKQAFDAELAAAAAAVDHAKAMHHLSRAHILSQRHTAEHVRTHWLMLRAGLRALDLHEVLGQVPRALFAAAFSRIWVPLGNTGVARVGALRPMPIPDDLQALLD